MPVPTSASSASSPSREVQAHRADQTGDARRPPAPALARLGYLAGHGTITDRIADPVLADACRRCRRRRDDPDPRTARGQDLDPLHRRAPQTPYAVAAIRAPHLADHHRLQPEACRTVLSAPRRQPSPPASPSPGLTLAVAAAWMRYIEQDQRRGRTDERGPTHSAARLRRSSARRARPRRRRSRQLLTVREIFPEGYADDALRAGPPRPTDGSPSRAPRASAAAVAGVQRR